MPNSICPAGWRLPNNDELYEVFYNEHSDNFYAFYPNYIVPGGALSQQIDSVLAFSGNLWTYWTNSFYDSGSGEYIPAYAGARYGNVNDAPDSLWYGMGVGRSIRCVARGGSVVTFDANGGTGTMESQIFSEYGSDTLYYNRFVRDGYTFTGWNTKADGSGTPYSNSATYSGPSTTLYAQWTPTTFDIAFANAGKSKVTVGSNQYYKMQDISTTICNAVGQNQSGQLVDIRDNTIYNVGKLADGKCWLLDNLALDLTNSTVLNNMTPSNTNASTTSLTSLRSGNRSAGDQYATDGVSNWTSGYGSNSAPLINMASKDVVPSNAPANSKGNNKVGGYYNYCAASAGSYCYGDGPQFGTSSGNATEDICPAGWRMPTGGSDGEYKGLFIALTGNTDWRTTDETEVNAYRTALSVPLSGYSYNGSARDQGVYGHFWSSTRSGPFDMYYLHVETGGVKVDYGYDRPSNGDSVRCLVQ